MVEKFKGYKNFNPLVDDGYLEEDYRFVNGSRLDYYRGKGLYKGIEIRSSKYGVKRATKKWDVWYRNDFIAWHVSKPNAFKALKALLMNFDDLENFNYKELKL